MSGRHCALLVLLWGSALSGCGGKSHDEVTRCPPGWVLANPDGRGQRCIDAESECFDVGSCMATSPCCEASCADRDGDGLFACAVDCLPRECADDRECGPGSRCEIYDECRAQCVPDVECPPGQVLGDPDGRGFRCISVDSECFYEDDCPASTDPCCDSVCRDDQSGRYVCSLDCIPQYFRDADEAGVAPDCYTDEDCAFYGTGWVCDGCPGFCEWRPECTSNEDCVIATRADECCACPEAVSRAEKDADPCLVAPGEVAPEECEVYCPAIDCPAPCFEPAAAECVANECVEAYE